MDDQTLHAEQHLRGVDEPLGRVIAAVIKVNGELRAGSAKRESAFESLVRSVIGQQLSAKAAATIYTRLDASLGSITPEATLTKSISDLRALGISNMKAGFIRTLASHALNYPDYFSAMHGLEDREVVASLMRIRGIGLWTAQMFLIFHLGRLDVMPSSDGGLQRAANKFFDIPKEQARHYLECRRELWRPFSSVACLYLWSAVDSGVIIE